MRNLRDYLLVTAAYWVFTLTDGALRMLVLLHLHGLGYAPLEIASLFLAYELFGVLTNLLGGWIGARFGLKSTLVVGLALQTGACVALGLRADALTVPLLVVAQAVTGTAKDLTKMSSKSYVKLVVPEGDQRGLLRWVSVLTGSKNALKGAGFFLGGFLLATLGFERGCYAMASALALAFAVSGLALPRAAGRTRSKPRLRGLLAKDGRLQRLAAARLFLFGARDVWFVLALPVFLSASLGWRHEAVGGFLAAWVIAYGCVQALAPTFLGTRAEGRQARPDPSRLPLWTASLLVPLVALAATLWNGVPAAPALVVGLVVFGVLFAANSALHSYLVVAFADRDEIALNVGYYYMANAAGRLVGTLLSGALFQAADEGLQGLVACLAGSIVFVFASSLFAASLARYDREHPASAPA